MVSMENKIISTVKKEVFSLFGKSQLLKGKDRVTVLLESKEILQRLAFGITPDCSIECNRLVLYNLAYVCMEMQDKTSARFYINNIKNIIDNNEEYRNNNYGTYCNIMNIYSECNKLSVSERIRINEDNLRYYEENNIEDNAFISKSNICLLKGHLDEMIDILTNIHIRIIMCTEKEIELMQKLEGASRGIFEDLKKYGTQELCEEALETLDNASYLHQIV